MIQQAVNNLNSFSKAINDFNQHRQQQEAFNYLNNSMFNDSYQQLNTNFYSMLHPPPPPPPTYHVNVNVSNLATSMSTAITNDRNNKIPNPPADVNNLATLTNVKNTQNFIRSLADPPSVNYDCNNLSNISKIFFLFVIFNRVLISRIG